MLEQTVKRMFSHMSAGERWNLKTGYSAGPGSPVRRKLLIYLHYDALKGLQARVLKFPAIVLPRERSQTPSAYLPF